MKKRFLDNVLDEFYKDGYVEDDRLTSDKMHYIEFITTQLIISLGEFI